MCVCKGRSSLWSDRGESDEREGTVKVKMEDGFNGDHANSSGQTVMFKLAVSNACSGELLEKRERERCGLMSHWLGGVRESVPGKRRTGAKTERE